MLDEHSMHRHLCTFALPDITSTSKSSTFYKLLLDKANLEQHLLVDCELLLAQLMSGKLQYKVHTFRIENIRRFNKRNMQRHAAHLSQFVEDSLERELDQVS